MGDALESLNGRIKVARDASGLSHPTKEPSRESSSPGGRRRGNNGSPDAARRSGSMSPREGVGTRLRDALEERMVDWASAAGQAVEARRWDRDRVGLGLCRTLPLTLTLTLTPDPNQARREARGEVALEPENDPATWPDARLVRLS